MVFGTATRVEDDDEKHQATMALLEHIAPGRSVDTRPPTTDELRATLMVRVPIAEGSAKVRTGGPIDEPERHGVRRSGPVRSRCRSWPVRRWPTACLPRGVADALLRALVPGRGAAQRWPATSGR